MSNLTVILILMAFAFGAAFVQRTTGFGFGIFIMTVLPYLLPTYGEATALSGMLALVTSVILAIHYSKFLEWKKLLPILITFLIVSLIAIQIVSHLDKHFLKKILGCTLIAASVYFWFFSEKIKIKPNKATQVSLGTLSGFMGGFFGMQGPPAVLYFIEVSKRKEEYVALAQTFFCIGNFVMTFYRWNAGFVSAEVIADWCWAVPAVLLGTYVGSLVFKYISLPLLKHIVFIYIGLSGLMELFF